MMNKDGKKPEKARDEEKQKDLKRLAEKMKKEIRKI